MYPPVPSWELTYPIKNHFWRWFSDFPFPIFIFYGTELQPVAALEKNTIKILMWTEGSYKLIPSRELTYPTWGKGKSSTQKCLSMGYVSSHQDIYCIPFWFENHLFCRRVVPHTWLFRSPNRTCIHITAAQEKHHHQVRSGWSGRPLNIKTLQWPKSLDFATLWCLGTNTLNIFSEWSWIGYEA